MPNINKYISLGDIFIDHYLKLGGKKQNRSTYMSDLRLLESKSSQFY